MINEKIKIAYITKEMSINGISNVIMSYCKNIDKNFFEITIFAGEPIDDKYIHECERININIEKMPPKRGKNPLKYYSYLLKKINNKNFDIVHIHGNSATILVELIISWINKVKVRIAHCHNTTCDKKIIHKIFQPFLKKFYTGAFSCSRDAGKWLFNNNKFVVIPNSFETSKFNFDDGYRKKIRKELGIENNELLIGHVGKFNDQKNHPFLLEVFEKVVNINKNVKLILVGSGPDVDKINKLINIHPYKDKIILFGECDNVEMLYSAMDIFVFPSKHEGLGIVLLEAQISGVNCITSDVIPKEAIISKDVMSLSLENSDIWAKAIVNMKIHDRYKVSINEREKSKYSISKNIKILEKYYIDFYTNDGGK